MKDKYFYSTDVEWTGARHGNLSSRALPTLTVDAPPEFKGHEGAWTPEHLFVGAVSSCFMTTFMAIAENSKLDFESFQTSAEGTLEKADGQGLMITEIVLHPTLTIRDEGDIARANRILEKAEKHCLIANSAKTQIRLEPEIKVVAAAN
ncbi:MAG TPA: OsmC family protein [Pyrinomonadaceae bacterium]|jgi:peroxiredoxin-like protein|nr:OsmC family protein [Pyrinomonadaceae bacterium]